MKKIYIITAITVALLGSLVAAYFVTNTPKKIETTQSTPTTSEPVAAEKVATYDTCLQDSETEYRAYVDKYGKTLYDLPQGDWDKVNSTRATQYSDCFNKYH